MLGKLFKYEMKSYTFSMGITFLVALAFTMCTKIMCMLPYRQDLREVIQTFCFMFVYYLLVMIIGVAQIIIIVNFYKTTAGDRGYLTWTLPAKTSAILWSKSIAGAIWYMISVAFMILCVFLFLIGDYWTGEVNMCKEISVAFSEMILTMREAFGVGFEIHGIIMIILTLLLFVIGTLFSFMMLYMCIAIGQLFGKWRILASIGVYLLIMFAIQVLYIVFVLVLSVGMVGFEEIMMDANPGIVMNITLAVFLFLCVIGYVVTFAITNKTFKNRLNLG